MPPPPPVIHELTDDVLERAYDSGSFGRGVAYATEGRTTVLSTSPNRVRGVVMGSSRQTYLTDISWMRSARGILIEDKCSCPLGGGCKHCVALLLTARRASTVTPRSTWRAALARVAVESERTEAESGTDRLALEFALHAPRRHVAGPQSAPLWMVQPLRWGKSGKWIKTGASWRDLTSPPPDALGRFDPEQRRALMAFMRVGTGNRYQALTGSLPLSAFGPELWSNLTRAIEAGVTLFATGGTSSTVVLHPLPARVTIDLTADAEGSSHCRRTSPSTTSR